jgi:hypothetical protein
MYINHFVVVHYVIGGGIYSNHFAHMDYRTLSL